MADDNRQTVSLGCGTLILIALIVMIFSNRRGELEREVRGLRWDVDELTSEVRALRESLQAIAGEQPTAGDD